MRRVLSNCLLEGKFTVLITGIRQRSFMARRHVISKLEGAGLRLLTTTMGGQ